MTEVGGAGLGRWGLILIAAAVALAFGVSVGGDFVFDDVHSVRDNPALRSLWNIPAFFVDVDLFSSLDCRLYRPILLTSFAIDAFLGGMEAWMFKLTNLLLHLAAAISIASIARCFGVDRSRAIFGACLFAVHPMASEAVNTVSGRSNILMVLGLLLAVRCHLAAMSGVRWAGLGTLICGAISMGCKEPGMILPVLLVILESLRWTRSSRESGFEPLRSAAARVMPAVLLVLGYVWIRAHYLGAASFAVNQWQGSGVDSGFTRGMATQLSSMAILLPDTLRMMVLPFGMTMDPVIPYHLDFASPWVWFGLLLMLVLTIQGLRSPVRHPLRFLGVCLAWGCAMPWVLKPLNHPYLEHRLYGVLAGLVMVVVALLPRLELATLTRRSKVPAVAGLVLLALISANRSLDFESRHKLWASELSRNPESKIAMSGMAVCCMEDRRFGEAKPYLEELVRVYPKRRDARMNLAEAELHMGRDGKPENAVEQARYLVEHWDRNPFYRLLLSRSLTALGDRTGDAGHFQEAVDQAMYCLEIAEPKALVYRTAASARRTQGDLESALEILDRSLAHGLDHVSVLLDRSLTLQDLGRYAEARAELRIARYRNPFDTRVLVALQDLGLRTVVPGRPH
jgi:tetratricopeptide (TPR) repeat protein